MIQKPVIARIPELYPENLKTLTALMDYLEELSAINGVFEIEIRVRVDDVDVWAVIGWGESGDPCVLRFESEPEVPKPVMRTDPNIFTTINNKLASSGAKTCSCGDYEYPGKGTCGPNGCYNRPA